MAKLHFIIVLSVLMVLSWAEDAESKPMVLEVRGTDIYISFGHEAGLAEGSLVTLEHAIEARDPATGALVRDTFPLGTMKVVVVGAKTAVVRASKSLLGRVRPGDEVSLASKPVAFVDPWAFPEQRGHGDPRHAPAAEARRRLAAEAEVRDDDALVAQWRATRGAPYAERLQAWRDFLERHPGSRHEPYIEMVLADLEARVAQEQALAAQTPLERATQEALGQLAILSTQSVEGRLVAQEAPTRGYHGEAIDVAFLLVGTEPVVGAWLYVRPEGSGSYQRLPLVASGDGYLRGTIPEHLVVAPGCEYFVEVRGRDEEPREAVGSAREPLRVAVDASVREAPPSGPGHSRVTLFADYVDFDGPSSSYDQYVHAEADFMYRFFSPIYSLRLGFGTISGHGGPKDVIDLGQGCMQNGEFRCRRVSYNYAFTEVERRLGQLFAVMLRVQWGSAYQDHEPMEGQEREFFDAFGVRGRIRLGREEASNLVLGATATERLGVLFEGAFTWDVIPRFPVVLGVQVTDQPVASDLGVRLISDIGWRHFDWVYPSLRIAYQARDIDHAGLSAGLVANFDW